MRVASRRRFPLWLIASLVLLIAVTPFGIALKGKGIKTRILHTLLPNDPRWMSHPSIASVKPAGGEWGVSPDSFIAFEVNLPNAGKVVDAATLNEGSVRLVKAGSGQVVAATVNTSAAGDVIVVRPARPLELNTQYFVQVLPAAKDTGGATFGRFIATFTTAAASEAVPMPIAFEQVMLPQTNGHRYTGLTLGPDGKLYACTGEGRILRFVLNSDGTTGRPEVVMSPRTTGGEPRLITGICFDPASTPLSPVLWVSHGQLAYQDAEDFTGKISRLSGADLDTFQDMIVGLPRACRDHLNNQLAFGPDGALYLCQASNSAMGAPDPGWGMRPERQLSAAILRIRTEWLGDTPLNVRTIDAGGKYDPSSAEAPLTIYARGIRNCFDLVWHTDGQLYVSVNGSSAGGSVPPFKVDGVEHPGMTNVRTTEADTLIRVEARAYYGHPVPARGESILDGGNPTAEEDPFEIPQYPVGTQPDPKWRLPVFDFGKHLSPCGLAEYKSGGKAFGGLLDGKILVTRYSGGKDIVALTPGGLKNGFAITEALAGIDGMTGLNDPLDVTVDPATGNVYVAEFGGQRLTLLRPKAGLSPRVYRQQPLKTIVTTAKPATGPATVPAGVIVDKAGASRD